MAWARRSKEDKETYFPNYAVTRKQKRYIANKKMEEEGRERFRHHSYTSIQKGNFITITRNPSYFAKHWREYVEEE